MFFMLDGKQEGSKYYFGSQGEMPAEGNSSLPAEAKLLLLPGIPGWSGREGPFLSSLPQAGREETPELTLQPAPH